MEQKVKHLKFKIILAALLVSFVISPVPGVRAQSDQPVVRAVLFYSPTCGHCEFVINETLLPMIEQYGDQLQIVGMDVTQPQGQAFFMDAMQKFKLESAGVPFLVIDDKYLIGSLDIPDQFPGLVESYLAQGGVDWPDIPGLKEALAASADTPQGTPSPAATPVPVVHVVLFYRSGCSHCQKLTEEAIPPLLEKYGSQLQMFGVDVSAPDGDAIYQAAIEQFDIDEFGVPTLILGDQVLVGGVQIEERFTGILEGYLAQGGVDWPDIPGLPEAIAKATEADALTAAAPTQPDPLQTSTAPAAVSPSSPSPTATPGILGMHTESPDWRDVFARDIAGNTLSVIVLLGMLGSVIWAFALFKKTNDTSLAGVWKRILPILCVAGFGVAGYLAYVETTQVEAVCGPVGDCNTVQQSEYARLFGILPIGVLGLLGYVAIFISWLVALYAGERFAGSAVMAIFVMAVFGTLFSIYLTFLEPFVIGATCVWCLTSAILMTALMLLMVRPAKAAFSGFVRSNRP
jgi:uncharacterized membrane protein/thiol-disulfide isomerase/thioredoxin